MLTACSISVQGSALYQRYNLLQAPAGTFGEGMLGFVNPANVGLLHSFETQFRWTTDADQVFRVNDWGAFAAARGAGFGMYRLRFGDITMTNYQASLGFGDDRLAVGVGYGWMSTDAALSAPNEWKAGVIWRPDRRLSLGVTGFFPDHNAAKIGLFEAGVRPFAAPLLTLFADAVITEGRSLTADDWSAGLACRVLPGVFVVGRYFGSESFTVGVQLDLGKGSLAAQGHYDRDRSAMMNSYLVRAGGLKTSLTEKGLKNKAYAVFQPKGVIDYQKFTFFEGSDARFYDLLRDLRAAANDPRIAVVALNLSRMSIRPEHAWELRQEMVRARKQGKRLIAFFENAGMTGYHLASAADEAVIDPQGSLVLTGMVMSRTYMKGTLEKLGLGFDEWRFWKYKSAYETYSRESFSEGDREQRTAYLDDWYELIRKDVCASRQFSSAKWDSLVDHSTIFSADRAKSAGLVDRLGRWSDLKEMLKERKQDRLLKISRSELWDNAVLEEQWGGRPKIALVYGLGVCDMDKGIRARRLQKVFADLAKQKNVKAVVFRVDSPGGSAMAADVVAEALKKCAAKKPVIISQGQVAGSGGYWISMYGDKIVAGPNTVTGSIGVIGGWVWDQGLGEKLGMTEDHVKRGAHADIEAGVTLPLLGLTVPRRNLTSDERAMIERWIREMYDSFVAKVAEGRDMTKEEAEAIAQGRFYSGLDGKQVGLVDEIGGLMTALALAKSEAKIADNQRVEIVEIPKTTSLSEYLGGMTRTQTLVSDPVVEYLRSVAEEPFQQLFRMLPDDYPSFEN